MNEASTGSRGSGRITAAGASLGAIGVVLGAFGAHALKTRVGVEALGWWQTAVEYQMWHALAVLVIGLSGQRHFHVPAVLIFAGVMIFSGTLYIMALGGPRWLGAVTPLGGAMMIVGWAMVAWRAALAREQR